MDPNNLNKSELLSSVNMASMFLKTPPLSSKTNPRGSSHNLPEYTPSIQTLHLATRHRLNVLGSKQGNTGRKKLSRTKSKQSNMLNRARCDSSGLSECGASQSSEMESIDRENADDYNFDDDEEHVLKRDTVRKSTVDQTTYNSACQKLKITPSSTVFRGLSTKILSMKRLDVGPKGAKACAIALASNITVETLDMESNSLGAEGVESVCDMLLDNCFIVELNLAYNKIGTLGLKIICDVLRVNEIIQKLDISGNCFQEKDATHIKEMLEDNIVLKQLILSHNEFREEGGEIISEALRKNVSLEVLDLSWNHLRRRGATSIAKSLEKNIGIHTLNLGWNGFFMDGCLELGKSLAMNSTLLHLDLSNNRIDRECLTHLLKAFRKNDTLTSIDLSHNPIGAEGASDIVDVLIAFPTANINYVDIHTQVVGADFIASIDKLPRVDFNVGRESSKDFKTEDDLNKIFQKDDPMMVLMEFARLKKLRLVDLFASLDKDMSGSLSHQEFRNGLLKSGVPLSKKALDILVTKLDDNNDGEVDFSELMIGQKDHKKKVHLLKQNADVNDVQFGQTEIGIISAKLLSIFNLTDMVREQRMSTSKGTNADKQEDSLRVGYVAQNWGAMKGLVKDTKQK